MRIFTQIPKSRVLLSVLLLLSSSIGYTYVHSGEHTNRDNRHHKSKTVQVINISSDLRLETISSQGNRQFIQPAGIRPFNTDAASIHVLKQRFKTLLVGKTVQLKIHRPGLAQVLYSGMDVAERLLYEGTANLDTNSMTGIGMHDQQKYINAAESAFQAKRGLWQQKPGYIQKFHHPLWGSNQIPQPMTNAPVFKP